MNPSLAFHPQVTNEIDATYWWYELEKPGLGERFLKSLDNTFDSILEFPEGPALLYADVRVRP